MTKEDKELLLKDLCARLPYGVKCTTKSLWNGIYTIVGYKNNRFFLDCPIYDEGDDEWMIESIVPYLRPMSFMTEEEKKEYHSYCECDGGDFTGEILYFDTIESFDYLNSIHVDYRNLIPLGLAIPITEENNPYKE